jgi:hypothetical protein
MSFSQVEVHIVLPATMELKDTHDIGESLQIKFEGLHNVEIAHVHTVRVSVLSVLRIFNLRLGLPLLPQMERAQGGITTSRES